MTQKHKTQNKIKTRRAGGSFEARRERALAREPVRYALGRAQVKRLPRHSNVPWRNAKLYGAFELDGDVPPRRGTN
eukprot:6134417-Prymnesium_polylepis.1